MNNEIKTWQQRIAERHGTDDPAFKLFGDRYYMTAEIAELRARIESLAADAERLDWLAKNSAYVAVNPHTKSCLWVLRNIFEIEGQDFRAAVDAAIAKEKAK